MGHDHWATELAVVCFTLAITFGAWDKGGKVVCARDQLGHHALHFGQRCLYMQWLASELGKCIGAKGELNIDMAKLGHQRKLQA